MALFDFIKPQWQRENPMQRYLGVKKLHDQEILTKIAKTDEDYEIRLAAVTNIEDESVIAEIAKNETNRDVCYKCIEKINDESLLIDIFKNATSDYCRNKELFDKVNDESFLIDVAKSDSRDRDYAIHRLNDEDTLVYVAKNDKNIYMREWAVERLMSISTLFENIADDDYVNILKEIEKVNYTTPSIYDFKNEEYKTMNGTEKIFDQEGKEVLIIDRNGHNYTSWDEYYELIGEKKKEIEHDAKVATNQWAKGNETDQFYSDNIICISENFKGSDKLPKYKRDCQQVSHASKLNPQTDRHTEMQKFYLCRFNRLRAIAVLGLENPEELNLNDFSANIVVFKNCNFSNLNETNITGKDKEIMIMGDESSIKPLMEVLPDKCMLI